jgi:hypothetical protein
MAKVTSSLLAVLLIGGTLLTQVSVVRAENGQIAAGVVGGLIGGALLGGALSGRPTYAPPPAYYAPAPAYIEEDEPVCRFVRQRFWDGYGYRIRRVQVCD